MTSYRFDVRITLQGPVLSQSSGSRDLGLDAAALRADDGTPTLPGNLIRGNLHHAWKRLGRIAADQGGSAEDWNPEHWLGAPSAEQTGDAPIRARLRFAPEWRADKPGAGTGAVRHRIAIEPDTGAVARMALQVIDTPFGADDQPVFVGSIDGELPDQAAVDALAERIRQGLEFAGAIGALKGVGFGRVLKAEVTAKARFLTGPTPAQLAGSERVGLTLLLDRPFCSARPHAKNNLFESDDLIPGGVIRGAMARRLFKTDRDTDCADARFAKLCEHFRHIAVSHALPVQATGGAVPPRPVVAPFSLVQAPDGPGSEDARLYDVALKTDSAGLIHDRAPAFAPDWKDSTLADNACGQTAKLRRVIVVRTAIDSNRGTADAGQLFATEAVVPDGHYWLADIDLGQVPAADRTLVTDQLALLLAEPLTQLGKTKAEATATLAPTPHPLALRQGDPQSGGLLRDGVAILCLQADALLLPRPWGLTGTGGSGELCRRYQTAWQQLSGGALALDCKRYFARQALLGGDFLHQRFTPKGQAYNPWLATLAGSVFVLLPTDPSPTGVAAAEAVLAGWQRQGLGQVHAEGDDSTTRAQRENWRHNPYLRENGYGAVAVNLELHWNLDPKEAWHGID